MGHGHQIYMHCLHKFLLVVTLAGCISMAIVITDLWYEGWYLQLHSFMVGRNGLDFFFQWCYMLRHLQFLIPYI